MHKKQQVQIYKSFWKKMHRFNIIMRNHNKFNLGMNSYLHFCILLLWFHEIFCFLLAIFRPKRLKFLENIILHVLKVFQILNYLKFRYSEKAKKFEKITCFLVKILKYQNNSYPLFKIGFIFNLICLKIEIDAAY